MPETTSPATPTATPAGSDDPRWEPGMPVLDRQAVREPVLPPSLQGLPPRSVPELRPTPLQKHYINLSVVALICGAIAITALEMGVPLGSPLVKLCVLIGAPLLFADHRRRRAPDLALGLGLDAGEPGSRPLPAGLVRGDGAS